MINTSHRKRNELLDEALAAQKAVEKRNNIIPRKRKKDKKQSKLNIRSLI